MLATMLYSIATLLLASTAMFEGKRLVATTEPSAHGPSLSTATRTETAVPMMFTGPLRAGGPNVTYNGTLQSIVKQIRAENPHYPFRNRTAFPITSGDNVIVEAITYLRDLTGTCYAFPGPDFCGRISWSYNSAVCFFADFVQTITNECCDQSEKQIQGQVFSEDGSYNVLVGRDWC
ncbi:hypothetical protein DL768_009616 [Monosporascus sp. mg162]|nr:hypothetical protein DL768_009616 [Monosporascus sp. mg162]